MRIISGLHKGRRIIAPKSLPVRPTTDRAKEALFNILQHQLDFSTLKVLDLFSGIGSISLEFASRGVRQLVAVDQHPKCVQFIKKTAEELDITLSVVKQDSLQFAKQNQHHFDLVFMDPPYAFTLNEYTELIQALLKNTATAAATIIAEHDPHHEFETHTAFVKSRNYGSCNFSFFEKKAGR